MSKTFDPDIKWMTELQQEETIEGSKLGNCWWKERSEGGSKFVPEESFPHREAVHAKGKKY